MFYKWNYTVHNLCDWLLTLSISFLRSMQVAVSTAGSFLFISAWCSVLWVCHRLSNPPPVEGHLGCFSLGFLQIRLLWTFMCRCLCENKFSFLWDKYWRVQLLELYLMHVQASFPFLFIFLFLPAHPLPPTFPAFSSCSWVIHISSLASIFSVLLLTSPVYLLPTIYATYSLYLFPPLSPPTPPLITLHVISFSVILFLF